MKLFKRFYCALLVCAPIIAILALAARATTSAAEPNNPVFATVTIASLDDLQTAVSQVAEKLERQDMANVIFELARSQKYVALLDSEKPITIAFATNEGPRCARNDGSRKRERKSAACAANEKPRMSSFAPQPHSSFGGNAATLHCGAAASSFAPEAHPSLVAPPLGGATFGPLLVERRKSTRGRGGREPWVLKSVDMIRREACDGLSAEALARRFPVSRNLFERRFREAMGHSVLDEIIHVRMQRVFDLLARPDFPIGAIADFSGFGCGYGLRTLFRARTGMSLREWRKTRN